MDQEFNASGQAAGGSEDGLVGSLVQPREAPAERRQDADAGDASESSQ